IRIADIKALAEKKLLQFGAFMPAQHPLVARPSLYEALSTPHPVGKVTNRERIGFSRVVLHDGAEVRQHQEARSLDTGRRQQLGVVGRAWKRLVAGTAETAPLPFMERQLSLPIGQREIEIRWNDHLIAPGLPRHPTDFLEMIGGRSEDIRQIVDHVAATIA